MTKGMDIKLDGLTAGQFMAAVSMLYDTLGQDGDAPLSIVALPDGFIRLEADANAEVIAAFQKKQADELQQMMKMLEGAA